MADAQREGVGPGQRGLLQGCNKGCDCGGYLSGQQIARWKYPRDVSGASRTTFFLSANTARGPRPSSRCLSPPLACVQVGPATPLWACSSRHASAGPATS